MSETMNASSAQATEQKLGMGDRIADTSKTFIKWPYTPIAISWSSVTIDSSAHTMTCSDGGPLFTGISSTSDSGEYISGTQSVYDLSTDSYALLVYVDSSEQTDPPATGIWMGTSSGGSAICRSKPDA